MVHPGNAADRVKSKIEKYGFLLLFNFAFLSHSCCDLFSLQKLYVKLHKRLKKTGEGVGSDQNEDAGGGINEDGTISVSKGNHVYMAFYIPADGPTMDMDSQALNIWGK